MSKYLINGGKPLNGEINIQGAKNSVLPILSASLLTQQKVVIRNVPRLRDVDNMLKILKNLGVDYQFEDNVVVITPSTLSSYEIPSGLARELRSSIFLLGSVLAREKRAKVAYPGGCDIGLRPIDLHIKALKEMGVKIVEGGGYVYCDAENMEPSSITLDYPSVGATENVMLLATAIDGVTTIANSAEEPEIEDLQNFINAMGGEVSGAGTPFLKIKGGKPLKSVDYTVMPDRIEAGTFIIGTVLTGGEVLLKGARADHLNALFSKIQKWDCKIEWSGGNILVSASGKRGELGIIETKPYPGFPTDLQAEICVLGAVANGSTMIVENLFETRYKHIPELQKMGAQVKVKDRIAVFNGVKELTGAEVNAFDLRGGAGLVLAGLIARGVTEVNNVHFIERGYEDFDIKLRKLGADIIKK
ncbi:MAG: UDP-N-acetylglucosamine 1-carboxyvinyltransferase [Clostridia bacterium]|nr:UDP-N-acetylglucosamine 1-carboxyvinyltransferase [Clostridia bacterium]